MARRHKKKTKQLPQGPGGKAAATAANGANRANPNERIPKTMVIRMGGSDIGPSISQLVLDMRNVMEPHTASKLKERRSNKLRDYTTMAGPLGVTQLLLFYRSKASGNPNFKIATAPRGPTLSFHVDRYSLAKDIAKSQRRPKNGSGGMDHLTPPLLVMNNFVTPQSDNTATVKALSNSTASEKQSIPRHLETLTTSVFQSLFPPISPQRTPLSTIRRVLLINRELDPQNPASYILTLRHYAITSRVLTKQSKAIKRMQAAEKNLKQKGKRGKIPDISHLQDIGEFMDEHGGFTSASESEIETDAEVEVLETRARKVLPKKEFAKLRQRQKEERMAAAESRQDGDEEEEEEENGDTRNGSPMAAKPSAAVVQKKAIKLTEIGPRMTLRLYKVEEGLASGKVMWHESIVKSEDEQKRLDHLWEIRRAEREERKRVQRENVERKRAAQKKEAKSTTNGAEPSENDAADEDQDFWSDEDELDEEDGGVDIPAEDEHTEVDMEDADREDELSDAMSDQ